MHLQQFQFQLGSLVRLREPDDRQLPPVGEVVALTLSHKGTMASVRWGEDRQRASAELESNLVLALGR